MSVRTSMTMTAVQSYSLPANFLQQLPQYPLSELFDLFMQRLAQGTVLLEAEPGAGKSTLAPLWILSQTPNDKKILLVQPRVLAAQSLAQRLSELVGDQLGQTVGYHVPYDRCMDKGTRLVVMTPGILLQYLLQDALLESVDCVILDEIHERSVNQDTAWAWLQEVQLLRDDLRVVLMSATPDPQLQQQIPQRLFTPGRCFPVTTRYLPPKQSQQKNASPYPEKIADHVVRALVQDAQWQQSTVLVFLAGWNDIEQCADLIKTQYPQHAVFRLHSRVPAQEQKRALNPASGPRIILSTNIAETSLTIPDVTLVIDSGSVRRPDYEQRTGLTHLRNARISQASADQRRGRAGRVQAGRCIRLWSQDQPLAAADLPEIRATDYLPLALRLAHWGSPPNTLPWLEAPNKLALEFAHQHLCAMQFIDDNKKITTKGLRVSALGTHPRIAAVLLDHENVIAEETILFALALHFELSSDLDSDDVLERAAQELRKNPQWQQQQKRWLSELHLSIEKKGSINVASLARAFSDRIGYVQSSGRYRLNSGISVEPQHAIDSPWALFPMINPKPKGHRGLGFAIALTPHEQRALSQRSTQLIRKQNGWHEHVQWRMGGVVVDEVFELIASYRIAAVLVEHIREQAIARSLDQCGWTPSAQALLHRARLLKELGVIELPELTESALVNSLDQWLAPFLTAQTTLDQLPWENALRFYLGFDQCQRIADALPDKMALPSGRQATIDFSAEGIPQISAKLQEFFGCEQLQLADGKIPLKIHLLSPNGSPVAITMNLKTFWQQGYPDVRKDMRGKYPRHPWPENPYEHEATALTKRKLAQRDNE